MTIATPWAALPVLLCSALMLLFDRRRGGLVELFYFACLLPLAWVVVSPAQLSALTPAVAAALVVALLTRQRGDLLQSECGLKLLWVLASALALSWAGVTLLAVTTGTTRLDEQWAAIAIELEPSLLWTTSLSLSLLGGFVLLGTAPFHFWVADLLQGARPWLAAVSVAALQTCGAVWIALRLRGIGALPDADRIVAGLLDSAAAAALAIGAATLTFQRRPERRVGTLASLNGGLMLAALALEHGARRPVAGTLPSIEAWAAHLALALSGASVLARFLPISDRTLGAGPVLFRRHPLWGALGLYAMASLAGVPGTPGSLLWLATGRACMSASRPGLALLIGLAWTAGFAGVVRQIREAFGVSSDAPLPARPVPWLARGTMAVAFAGLVAMAALRWR